MGRYLSSEIVYGFQIDDWDSEIGDMWKVCDDIEDIEYTYAGDSDWADTPYIIFFKRSSISFPDGGGPLNWQEVDDARQDVEQSNVFQRMTEVREIFTKLVGPGVEFGPELSAIQWFLVNSYG